MIDQRRELNSSYRKKSENQSLNDLAETLESLVSAGLLVASFDSDADQPRYTPAKRSEG